MTAGLGPGAWGVGGRAVGRPTRRGTSGAAASCLLLLLALGACEQGEDAITRGDRLWADSSYTAALAEYRLASARGGDEARLRLAHAHAELGQLEEAREVYAELIEEDRDLIDQAVYDYLEMASRARERGDPYGMTRAVEAALALRPGLDLGPLSEAVADYYASNASSSQALAFLERSLADAPPDSATQIVFRIGRLRAEGGQCEAALPYLRSYLARAPEGEHASDARWTIGNCAFQAARTAHQAGNLTDALESLETTIELGMPANLQDQAWFLRGDILYALGRNDEALEAYRRVIELNPARTGQLVERAQRQIDRIRFGI